MELEFKEPPRIANRSDALELLNILLNPHVESVGGLNIALQALKNVIEREII
jgi:hypothetical protein